MSEEEFTRQETEILEDDEKTNAVRKQHDILMQNPEFAKGFENFVKSMSQINGQKNFSFTVEDVKKSL